MTQSVNNYKEENKILVAEKNTELKSKMKQEKKLVNKNHVESLPVNSKFLIKSTTTEYSMVNKSTNLQSNNVLASNDPSPVPAPNQDLNCNYKMSETIKTFDDDEDILINKKRDIFEADEEIFDEAKLESEDNPEAPIENDKPITTEEFLVLMEEYREQCKADREEIFKDFGKKDDER